MSADKSSSWSYAEDLPAEDDVLLRARERSFELGVTPISPGVGAVLTVLAAASKAQTVVEVGSGAGVSGVCLLRGLSPHAVLTTIDVDVEHLKAAREAFLESGSPANRTRTISGRAADVLPRLTDSAYDLVFIDADKPNFPKYVEQAIRLLKSGASPIPQLGMPPRWFCVRSARPFATTSGWLRRCCPPAMDFWWPSRSRAVQQTRPEPVARA
jgi:predicted O-methyltransferase YrrM